MNKIKLILSFFLLGAALLRGEGPSNYVPESRSAFETFTTKVLKVYAFQDGDYEYVAYVVNWKDHEVVVAPIGSAASEAKLKEGDTIRCTMQQANHRIGDTNKSRISFYIASGSNLAESPQRLEAIAAEVKERRERRRAGLFMSASSSAESEKVVIRIQANGTVKLGNLVVSDDTLKQKLSEIAKQDKESPILVVADEKVSLETVTKVMDQCRKSGLNKFSMQTGSAD